MSCVVFAYAEAQEFPQLGVRVETVAENLEIPWEMAFAPDGRIFVTERTGSLIVIQPDGTIHTVASITVSGGEGGLLGLALDPRFSDNSWIYLYYSYRDSGDIYNKIVRYTEQDGMLVDQTILLDNIPGNRLHDGGRIKFGPDGMLYATTGDVLKASLAQDPDSLAGKILRMHPDGSIPEDNPFLDSVVFSTGHRNPQGIDWHLQNDLLVATDHGPSGERGIAHDEINAVLPGSNHGWPEIIGDEAKDGLTPPVLHTGDQTWAPSGSVFYDSHHIKDWHGAYIVATLRGEHLRLLYLDPTDIRVTDSVEMFAGEFGRLRTAAMGPDGHLYILTSNTDGRGDPAINDDRLLRIVPLESLPHASLLEQIQSGVLPHNVLCNDGFKLVVRTGELASLPVACVKNSSVERLVMLGWAQAV